MAKENYYTFIQRRPGSSKSVQPDMLAIHNKRYLRRVLRHRKVMNMTVRTSDDHNYTKPNAKQSPEVYYNIIITNVIYRVQVIPLLKLTARAS